MGLAQRTVSDNLAEIPKTVKALKSAFHEGKDAIKIADTMKARSHDVTELPPRKYPGLRNLAVKSGGLMMKPPKLKDIDTEGSGTACVRYPFQMNAERASSRRRWRNEPVVMP
ncbi:MAG: hypothetical protein M1351_02345 [Candidatus Thermoplasmatota archaeon]|nr:hypothetical protein [Candidatus Thermoplasmatota archaeon]